MQIRALVSQWRALVVFLAVLVGWGTAGAQTIEIPQTCATESVIQGFLDQIEQRKDAEISCTIGGQVHKFTTGHVWWALKHYGDTGHGYPFKDFVANISNTFSGNGTPDYIPAGPGLGFCFLPDNTTRALIYKINYGGDDPGLSIAYPLAGGQCDWRAGGNQSTMGVYLTAYGNAMSSMFLNAAVAYRAAPTQMFRQPFTNLIWSMTFAQTAPWSEVYPPETGSDGGTPPAGSPTTCTRPDGTQSTNQYECAPTDTETSCPVLNVPCNIKKLFLPSPDFFSSLFSMAALSKSLDLPVQSTDTWEFDLAGTHLVLDWRTIPIPQEVHTVLLGLFWYGNFLWMVSFFGLPNPWGNKRGDSSVVRQIHDRGNP